MKKKFYPFDITVFNRRIKVVDSMKDSKEEIAQKKLTDKE